MQRSTTRSKARSTPSGKESWKPHKGQQLALKFLMSRHAAALFLDPGFGKTSISYAGLSVLKKEGLLRGALVVAPRRPAVGTWPDEKERWAEFEDLDVVLLRGPKFDTLAREKHDVYIVTYEGLDRLIKDGHMKFLLQKKWLCTLVIDELSKVKNHTSQRHKNIGDWRDRFKRCWGLTGSPASNGLLNLFGEMYIVDQGRALGRYYTHYRAMYFQPVNPESDFPRFEPMAGAEQLIFKQLRESALRLEPGQYYKQPVIVPNLIKAELEPKARRIYDTMEDEMMAFLDDAGEDLVTAVTRGAALQKCQQLASGAVYEDKVDPVTGIPRTGKRLWTPVHDEKIELLDDLLDSLEGQPLLVGYWFGHDLQRIQELAKRRYGEEVPYIGAGVSDKRAIGYEKAWNANQIPLMLCQPGSVGHGMNFQRGNAHHLCWFTLPNYDYEVYDQFNKRLARQGNTAASVFVHHLIVKGTVDELQYAAMNSKRRGQDRLFQALTGYRAGRKVVVAR